MKLRKSAISLEEDFSHQIVQPQSTKKVDQIASPPKTQLNAEEFVKLLKRNIDDESYQKFEQIFLLQLKEAEKTKKNNVKFIFPIILDDNKQYLRLKLNMFATEYTSEAEKFNLDLKNNYVESIENKQKQSIKQNSQEISYEQGQQYTKVPTFLRNKPKALDSLTSFCVSEYFTTVLENCKELVRDQIENSQENGLLDTYVDLIQQLLEFNAIKLGQCEEQINENQIAELKYFEVNTYFNDWEMHPVRQYSSAQCKKKQQLLPFPQSQQLEQVHHSVSLQQKQNLEEKEKKMQRNILLDSWKIISSNVDKVMKKIIDEMQVQYQNFGGLRGKIKQILLKALDNIFLAFRKTTSIYASISEASIIININHNGSLTLRQCRQGPLQPYICLCIYHELTHLLVRDLKQCNIKRYDKSFDLKAQSLGNCLVQSLKRQLQFLPSYLKLAKKSKSQQKRSLEIFQATKIKISKLFFSLQQKHEILKPSLGYLKDRLNLFDQFLQFQPKKCQFNAKQVYLYIDELLRVYSSSEQQNKGDDHKEIQQQLNIQKDMWEKWRRLKHYSQKKKKNRTLQKSDSKKRAWIEVQEDTEELAQWQNQRVYRFFFSLFLTRQIAKQWFGQRQQLKYETYRRKIQQIRITKYFIQKNQAIQRIVKEITTGEQKYKQLFSSFIVDEYCYYTLNRRGTLEDFQQMLERYCSDIEEKDLQKLITICKQIFKSDIPLTFFDNFDLETFIAYKRRSNLIFFSDKITKESKYFLDKFKLARMMGYILLIDSYKEIFEQFMKYTEIYQILFQLPPFLTSNAFRKYQSGYDTERRLFKNSNDKIYAKDYHHLKLLNFKDERDLVGVEPQQQSQRRLYMNTGRTGKQNPHVDIGQKICWTHKLGELKAGNRALERQLEELKKKMKGVFIRDM